MLQQNFVPLYLVLAMGIGAPLAVYLSRPDTCPEFYSELSQGEVESLPAELHTITDVFPVELNGDGQTDLLISQLAGDQSIVRALLQESGRFVPAPEGFWPDFAWQHPRHVSAADINQDGRQDFLIVDHGPDVDPFPGGLSRIFLSQSDGGYRLAEDFQPLRTFAFHGALLDWNRDGRKDVFLSALPMADRGPALYMQAEAGAFHRRIEDLPAALRDGQTCFMSAATLDLDQDGIEELLLGGCDNPVRKVHQRHDRILRFSEKGQYDFIDRLLVPRRNSKRDWGTAAFTLADFDRDGRTDVLAVTHDAGFHQGGLTLYWNKSRPGKPRLSDSVFIFPFDGAQFPETFMAWADASDFDGNGFDDVVFALRPSRPEFSDAGDQPRSLRYFENHKGRFKDRSQCLPPLAFRPFSVHGIDLNGDGRKELVGFGPSQYQAIHFKPIRN